MSAPATNVRISDKFMATTDSCKLCSKRVYEMEKIIADQAVYHKACFRCTHCNRVLSLGNYTASAGAAYCKPHFIELFKVKGNYDEGFGKQMKSKQISRGEVDGIKANDGLDASKKTSKWDKPKTVAPPPVNRGDDPEGGMNPAAGGDPNEMPAPSTTRNMRELFSNPQGGAGGVATTGGGIDGDELPEEGTTRALLAKFKGLQGSEKGAAATAPKQPVKLYDANEGAAPDRAPPAPTSRVLAPSPPPQAPMAAPPAAAPSRHDDDDFDQGYADEDGGVVEHRHANGAAANHSNGAAREEEEVEEDEGQGGGRSGDEAYGGEGEEGVVEGGGIYHRGDEEGCEQRGEGEGEYEANEVHLRYEGQEEGEGEGHGQVGGQDEGHAQGEGHEQYSDEGEQVEEDRM